MFLFLTTFAITALFAFYVYRKFYKHQLFKKLGIPGPEPHWLFGNTQQLYKADRHLILMRWSAKYGPYFGIYQGSRPFLIISSPEMVEAVCIKQFSEFQGHSLSPVYPDFEKDPHGIMNSMFWAKGERWKRLRTICNPGFTSGKLKSYMNSVTKSQQDLIDLLEGKARSGENFNSQAVFQLLTLDVIGEVGFSLQFDAIKNEGKGNFMLETIRSMFAEASESPPLMHAALIVDELAPLFKALAKIALKLRLGFFGTLIDLYSSMQHIVDQRRKQPGQSNDILEMMIAVSDGKVSTDETKQLTSSKSMSPKELVDQSLLLFNAGYETTSTTLGYAAYLLAKKSRRSGQISG